MNISSWKDFKIGTRYRLKAWSKKDNSVLCIGFTEKGIPVLQSNGLTTKHEFVNLPAAFSNKNNNSELAEEWEVYNGPKEYWLGLDSQGSVRAVSEDFIGIPLEYTTMKVREVR